MSVELPIPENNHQEIINRVLGKFYVLRDRTGIALNVSYSPDGLKHTYNKVGRNLYKKVLTEGGAIEPFVPKTFKDPHMQKAEVTWLLKAVKMLY